MVESRVEDLFMLFGRKFEFCRFNACKSCADSW